MDSNCTGSHRFHIAEVVGVEAEGTVTVITSCIQCGMSIFETKQISHSGAPFRMLLEEKLQGA